MTGGASFPRKPGRVPAAGRRIRVAGTTIVAASYASRLGPIAFAATAIRGLLDGADFQGTLTAALVSLAAFYGLGLIVGELARRLVEENAAAEFAESREKHSDAQREIDASAPAR